RRHTRWPRDWSSDVCSSDLSFAFTRATAAVPAAADRRGECERTREDLFALAETWAWAERRVSRACQRDPRDACHLSRTTVSACRSEERRVGKGWRVWGAVWQ